MNMNKKIIIWFFWVNMMQSSDILNLGEQRFQKLKHELFHEAMIGNRIKIEDCLKKANENNLDNFINWQNENGDTALILAAKENEESSVRCLLEHKANPNILNFKKESAPYWSIKNKNRNLLGVLLGFGKADVNCLVTLDSVPLLWIAIMSGNQEVINTLKDYKASLGGYNYQDIINKWDNNENTLLLKVIKYSSENSDSSNVVANLLDLGADPNLTNGASNTALAAAVIVGNAKIVEVLLESTQVVVDKKELQRLLNFAKTMKDAAIITLLENKINEGASRGWVSWIFGK